MPRRRRAFHEGLFHLAPRASDTRYLFPDGASRDAFLAALAAVLERFEIGLVAYTLMGTHYHLVVKTPHGGVPEVLQRLHTWYARTHNKQHERSAHLFRAHYFAREIESDADLLTVCRYLAHNPVRAKLARDPFSWRWSSAATTGGLAPAPTALDLEPLRDALGDRDDWRRVYRAFIEAGDEEMELAGLEPATSWVRSS